MKKLGKHRSRLKILANILSVINNNKGAKKAHKTAVLGKGATYQRIGLMPSEMQYGEMRKWNRNLGTLRDENS